MDKAMHSEFEGHTPGPWVSRLTEDGFEVIQVEKKPSIGRIIICDNIEQGENDGEEDAKLIAAAPDLLKENQSLRSELQKQKELNAELVKEFTALADFLAEEGYQAIPDAMKGIIIKKSQSA